MSDRGYYTSRYATRSNSSARWGVFRRSGNERRDKLAAGPFDMFADASLKCDDLNSYLLDAPEDYVPEGHCACGSALNESGECPRCQRVGKLFLDKLYADNPEHPFCLIAQEKGEWAPPISKEREDELVARGMKIVHRLMEKHAP